jgi:hypothetical protein
MSPISRPLSRAGLSQAYRRLRTPPPPSRWGAAGFYQGSHIGDDDTISPSLYHKVQVKPPSHLWICMILVVTGAFGSILYVISRSTLSQVLSRVLSTVGEGF